MNAKINAGESVHAEAGKGLITGGRVIAGKEINAKNVGSAMGASTILEVGSDPEVKKQYAQLQKDVAEKTKSLSQMKQVMAATAQKLQAGTKLTTEQVMNFKAIQQQAVQLQGEIAADLAQIEQMDEMMRFDENAHINVRGTMYQGVAVTISGINMAVKSEYTYCRLVRKGADIASTNLI